jgi:hypothetical protein
MLHCVLEETVPDAEKDHSAFIFIFKQSKQCEANTLHGLLDAADY